MNLSIILSNLNNGKIMIAIFALVCVILVAIVVGFLMNSNKKKQ
ncbi:MULTISPECIES: hypothetical protein [unclassified Cellulophaga]|nr:MULTISPECIES: hypothetical protein [unclassified Cellulophaga]MDO6490624.1 hypothetical protein [Cellulophaga sp. 2_MG-2023]MDO6494182.1 hypothetical protein [Cellulophaga sp. 3_MG-2023]